MGTRADFYAGKGPDAEWLGSIARDGYPSGMSDQIRGCGSEAEFRQAVTEFLAGRDDATLPEQGWPWPWETSGTTDYSYWHFDGHTYASCFGGDLSLANRERDDEDEDDEPVPDAESFAFPDMSARKNTAAAGSNRSGIMVFVG